MKITIRPELHTFFEDISCGSIFYFQEGFPPRPGDDPFMKIMVDGSREFCVNLRTGETQRCDGNMEIYKAFTRVKE